MSIKDDKDTSAMTSGLGFAGDRLTSASILEPGYVRSRLDTAIAIGSQDPFRAISSAVEIGSTIASLLSSSYATTSKAATEINLSDTISALGELNRPYDRLASVATFEPYIGSMTSLASVSSVASTVKSLTGLRPDNSLLTVKALDVQPSLSKLIIEPSGLVSTHKVAGVSLSSQGVSFPPILSLSPSILAGALTSTTLASTRAVLGVESAYAHFAADDYRSPFTVAEPVPYYVTTLHEGLNSLTLAAKTSWEVLSHKAEAIGGMSLFSARSPAIEIYSASHAAAVISLPTNRFPPIDKETEEIIETSVDQFEGRLSTLEPALVDMYRGGVTALERGGPDWRRQTMVSFRELTTHVMHILAPDSDLKGWAKPEHFDKGKLTRKARLEYIFESVADGALTDFFKADLNASIKLFDLLNSGTHRLSSRATSAQLKYLRSRIVNFVDAMLEARGH